MVITTGTFWMSSFMYLVMVLMLENIRDLDHHVVGTFKLGVRPSAVDGLV